MDPGPSSRAQASKAAGAERSEPPERSPRDRAREIARGGRSWIESVRGSNRAPAWHAPGPVPHRDGCGAGRRRGDRTGRVGSSRPCPGIGHGGHLMASSARRCRASTVGGAAALLMVAIATARGSDRLVATPQGPSVALVRVSGRHFVDPRAGSSCCVASTSRAIPRCRRSIRTSAPTDLDRAAALGFNVIRLLFLWEAYEPSPGCLRRVLSRRGTGRGPRGGGAGDVHDRRLPPGRLLPACLVRLRRRLPALGRHAEGPTLDPRQRSAIAPPGPPGWPSTRPRTSPSTISSPIRSGSARGTWRCSAGSPRPSRASRG